MRSKTWSILEFKKVLRNNGYSLNRVTGSHEIWKKENNSIVVTTGRINKMVARKIIKENNLIIKEDK